MRILLLSFFLLTMTISFGQNQPATSVDREDLNEKSLEKDKEGIVADSVSTKTINEEYRSVKKDKKEALGRKEKSVVSPGTYKVEISEDEESGSQQSYESALSNFKYTKAQSSKQRSQRSPSESQQAEMNDAVGYFELNSPNSFEYHYFKFVSGNYDVRLYSHLLKAEKLRVNNADVHVQIAAYHMIKNHKIEGTDYIDKLIKANRLSASVLKYAEDLLLSVPKNGTLITHGFDDSYATWYLLNKKGIRTDIKLVSLDFMQSEYYRAALKKDGYSLPKSSSIGVSYFGQFCKLNSSKKISASLTMPKEYFKPVMSKVYVVGLVFEYHNSAFDNFISNENLWNTSLKKHLVKDAHDEKSKQLSSNYLPMLLQMRKVYRQKGNQGKVDEIDRVIDKIGVQCKKYEQVQKLKGAY